MPEKDNGQEPAPQRPVAFLTAGPVRERADAARNRARVLETARHLFAERGASCVTMDDIAEAAGVGKGTLYRRFGDRAGLATALLDDADRALQAAVLSGPPPVGYGAPPLERLTAFIRAFVEYLEQTHDLQTVAEASPGSRYRSDPYAFWRAHVAALLREGGVHPPGLTADVVLAPLAMDLYNHLRQTASPTEIADAVVNVVTAVLAPR